MRAVFFLLALVSLSLLSIVAADNSLGGSMDRSYARMSTGSLEKFEIKLFSLKNATVEISISAGPVQDLQVNVVPVNLRIEGGLTARPNPEYRWVIIDGDKYARLYPVYVYVRVPQKVSKSHYSVPVTVSSTVFSSSGEENGIVQKVVQVLQYNINIDVSGQISPEGQLEYYDNQGNISNPINPEDYPAYQLPGSIASGISGIVNTLSGFFSSPTEPDKASASGSDSSKAGQSGSGKPAKTAPTGFLTFDNDKAGGINFIILILAIVLVAAIVYLIKK